MSYPVPIILLGITLVVSTILILVAGRREEAGADRRSEARYLAALSYIVVFVALLASFMIVFGIMDLILDAPVRSNNGNWRLITQAGLVTLTAAGIFAWHYRYRMRLRAENFYDAAARSRVARAYFFAVCFTAAIIVLMSAPAAIYGLFRIIAPGVYGLARARHGRQIGVRELVSFGYLALGAVAIFGVSWRRVTSTAEPRPAAPTP